MRDKVEEFFAPPAQMEFPVAVPSLNGKQRGAEKIVHGKVHIYEAATEVQSGRGRGNSLGVSGGGSGNGGPRGKV